MNKEFGKIVDGKIVYAPDSLDAEGGVKMNPSESSYLAAGWKKIIDEKPAAKDGFHPEIAGWKEEDAGIVAVYKMVADSVEKAPARVFSKYKLVIALKEVGQWVLVKTWLEEKAYWDLYLAANNFAEDDPYFREALEAIKGYTGYTDKEVEAVLSKCIYEE